MKSVSSKIYTKEYYLKSCLGFEEFKKFKGKKVHPRINAFLDLITITKGDQVLDIGCGRGDLAIECVRRGASVVGIDYSHDGIELAKSAVKKQPQNIQKKIKFHVMDAKQLKFKDNSFDIITSFDVFEHLYKDELELAMREIKRVLKPGGKLLVHTETNKIYLDFTHHVWSYPMDQLLIKINSSLTKKEYPGLPKDPRNDLHKKQHVNEPTYFYLTQLFRRHGFTGKVMPLVSAKPAISWKDSIYNKVVSLLPLSRLFPFHLLFAHDFICIMENKK